MTHTHPSGRDATPQPNPSESTDQTILHASCVAIEGRGLLILGASGSGKSGLALTLMALGAKLVADDRVILSRKNNALIASAPASISGLIEARGIGLLKAHISSEVAVTLVVDLDQTESERMPRLREIDILGRTLTLLFKVDAPYFPAALVQYLKAGRQDG